MKRNVLDSGSENVSLIKILNQFELAIAVGTGPGLHID